ncbi:UDP-N-acetylmuramoyl-tripeptide--D-alanyl-D-alanine ligase [Actinobacteria bacterium YIM 96077]|uniref:UDP-N-acetylmuramoyl-tripeptide--D-alanyl-D-alanine ligase n=1 Tax=Phytoactinopolyspora halophila TaxID=1981511 RepID=A0A329QVL2_9ACTN|nr:UDP-N-acetylmuramoyl-tripeptide--D-alanyl-D-alanine ligase [Phytoactinopolyspora halophila]AYY12840.1 UDP-N-acetylmuramoyl-tripeptide--D-alanyl-D-alanine ligase [Actinobacteria bacterium YIM 96077]RAW16367.1 UDP-N-acetylmuramoyl-tripeptide--D-alanyl-D-alanine ligase [Phytoactinopolyspora halophila]
MIRLTLTEIADVTGGRLNDVAEDEQDAAVAATEVTGDVVVDSREAGPGGLFVARRGEHRDGHDYVAAASEAGVAAALVERIVADVGVPQIVVDDAERALGRLARGVVDRLPELVVVGVTGSSGKTTTKDLLAQALAPLGPVVAPPGSYNTEVGVPLTVLKADHTTRTLIVEMGARGIGHIRYLCGVAPPRIGVVLNVGSAHLGEFGDRESIAQAKGELIEALPREGTAVLNGDDQIVRRMAERAPTSVVMVGESVYADIRADDVELDGTGRASFTLVTPGGTAPVTLRLIGEHQVANALAVAGVAHALGMPTSDIADQLSAAHSLSRWRMEVTERPDGVTVVNDAYNANPESTRAALKALASMAQGRRTWAVLGEMLELGKDSAAEHDSIGRLAVRLNIDRLVAVGEGARAMQQGASLEGSWAGESTWVPDREAAAKLLASELSSGDVVLVKSSRDAGLRHLGEDLAGQEATT